MRDFNKKKHKSRKGKGCLIAVISVIAVLVLLLIINGGSINVNSIRISDVQVASKIDLETNKAITVTNTFKNDSPIIYVTVEIKNAPPDSKVSAKWIYIDEDFHIAYSSVDFNEVNQQAYFSLTMPDNGFPLGEYEVQLFLDDEYDKSVYFEVK